MKARLKRGTGFLPAVCLLLAVFSQRVNAQTLRFSNHREIHPPEYATVRIGPFYSSITFSQSAGFRYVRSSGAGTDYLFGNERGAIRKDGSEFPLISALDFRNYLALSETMDLDMSFRLVYSHYPRDTQEDDFNVELAEEGIVGNLSTEFRVGDAVRGTLYDAAVYRTDYIDTRGLTDEYGGERYRHFRNSAGMNADWLVRPNGNAEFSLLRSDYVPMEDDFKDQERVSYGETAGYQHAFSEFLILGAQGRFNQNAYSSTNRGDSASRSFVMRLDARLTESTIGAVSAGYTAASVSGKAVNDAEKDTRTAVGSAGLRNTPTDGVRQSIEYTRMVSEGFSSAFETADRYGYRIRWEGLFTVAELSMSYTAVEPSRSDLTRYRDWLTRLTIDQPVTPAITLNLAAGYDCRWNDGVSVYGAGEELEWRYDYSTWSARVGTSFALWENAQFSTYFQHVDRNSDSDELSYRRDIYAAILRYTHEF